LTEIGPGFVYGLFALAALPLLALPITLLAHFLGRLLGGFTAGLVGALAVPLFVGVTFAVATGFDLGTARYPLLLGGAYVLVPVVVGRVVLGLAGATGDDALRWATDGWLGAATLATLATFAGFGVVRFVRGSPDLLGVAWFGGYLGYLVGLGVLGGLLGAAEYRRRRRGLRLADRVAAVR
jgi:hypothetical protein